MSKTHQGRISLTGLVKQASSPSLQAKSNYEVLKGNREKTLRFADSVISSKDPGAPFSDAKIIEARKNVRGLVARGEWSKAISMLDEIKDNRIGIVWHKSDNLGVNGTGAIVRDARGVTTDVKALKQEQGEKYAMQILNEVRGGLALVEKSASSEEQKQEARARLNYIAESAMVNMAGLNSSNVKEFNTQIVHSLERGGISKAGKKLVFAKEVGNLKDEHCHIVTLTNAKDLAGRVHAVVEADVMLNGLTEEQRYQYETVRDSRKGARTQIPWFDALDDYKKDLVRDIMPAILSGTKVMPTQFLKEMPGIKNAYEKTTAIKGPDDGERLEVLTQSLHSGTPATRIKVGKREKEQIVRENIKQMQSFLSPDEKLNLNILYGRVVVPVPGINENDLYDQVHDVSFGKDVSVTASSINRSRHLAGSFSNSAGGGRDTKTYEEVLQNIAEGLTQSIDGGDAILTPESVKFFQTGNKADKQAIEKKIDDIQNPELSTMLKTMVRCRELADANTIQSADSDNINLEMTAKMNVIIGSAKIEGRALHGVLSEDVVKKIPKSADFCKSGKDRTGYAETKISHEGVNAYLGIDKTTDEGRKLAQENLLSQGAGNHTPEMAGKQGATVGTPGIKLSLSTQLAKEDKILKGVIDQESAGFNSEIHVKTGSKGKNIIAQFEKDFQEYQASQTKPSVSQAKTSSPEVSQTSPAASSQATSSAPRQAAPSANPTAHQAQAPASEPKLQSVTQQQSAQQGVSPDLSGRYEPKRQSTSASQEVPAFMQELYSDMLEKQEMHKKALDVFKVKMTSSRSAEELKAAMAEYRPHLESFEKDVARFEEQQKAFEAVGANLHQSNPAAKGPESKGLNDELKRVFEKVKQAGAKGGSQRRASTQRGSGHSLP